MGIRMCVDGNCPPSEQLYTEEHVRATNSHANNHIPQTTGSQQEDLNGDKSGLFTH